ncbi:hypothetical protein Tco_0676273 [Tanacetum coccineum]
MHLLQKCLLSLLCGIIATKSCLYGSKQSLGIRAFSSVVTGPGVIEVEVPSAFAVVRVVGLKELPFFMTSHRA